MLKFNALPLKSRIQVAEDAYCLTFEVPEALWEEYAFLPGQHLAVRAMHRGKTLRRTYSIVLAHSSPHPLAAKPLRARPFPSVTTSPQGEVGYGAEVGIERVSPASGQLKIGVRVQGEMSHYLTEVLRVGDALDVMTPNGSFHPLTEPERPKFYVAIAAGSGITPVLSIIASVLTLEPRSQFLLIYSNRNTARAMFVEELLALKNRYLERFAVYFVMSREPQEVQLFNGRVDAGKLRELAAQLFDPCKVDEYFLCGPGAMLEEISAELAALGATGKIHMERFGAVSKANGDAVVSRVDAAAKTGIADITVVMDGRRRTFKMPMNGESVLCAAENAGIELPFACRAGVCSTCRTRVTAGEVVMERNQALEDWEVASGYALCCQARPRSHSVELNYDEK